MPRTFLDRILPCMLVMTLTACNAPTSPPAANAPAAAGSVAATPALATAASSVAPTSASSASGTPAPVAYPAPEIIQLDLLDIGLATARDTLASLKQRYGAGNIKDGDVPGAEGEELDGWILYPDDPKRRVYVYLDEAGAHPSNLSVLDVESQWQRSDGIRMGLTLTELVKLNGHPVEFSGFGWDYGGTVSDLHHGALKAGAIGLCPPDFPHEQTPENYPSGDSLFSSDNDEVVRFPPTVCNFSVNLDAGPGKP